MEKTKNQKEEKEVSNSDVIYTFKFNNELEVNRLGYGTMQLNGAGVWGDSSNRDLDKRVLHSAVESGVNFIDTADAYGPHTNELLVKDAVGAYYDSIVIATKGGLERSGPGRWHVNGKPEYIALAIEGSLKRLDKQRIQLWQLHRVDPRIPIEETLAPVADAVRAGKIQYVGLSEVDIKVIERARKIVPIVSVQNLYNLSERGWEHIVDYTAKNSMAFIPWFPLASGPDKLKDRLAHIANKHNATTSQIALAWLLKRSPNILLIPGTSSLAHLQENMEAVQIKLTDREFEILSK
ncbi:aldo/keto reductase [Pedobacter psychroterrae]|uniref:Aldo/keto reductase n=1 Tax=Pedobacter psychroterrae TaxID=2530453 RepID=A0A4R0NKJ0_9SPHI|nr:aldo/keto reductase [Pedobacter psychroterrae]TCD01272.1 aldo/keto reductase [Pedobacter psychroterrae]